MEKILSQSLIKWPKNALIYFGIIKAAVKKQNNSFWYMSAQVYVRVHARVCE